MSVHVGPYVNDDAEFPELMAELRLWRKEVRWCVQRLLEEGTRYTIELTAPSLGAALYREAFGLYSVEVTSKAVHGRSWHQMEKGDFLVGMNNMNLVVDDLSLADVTSRVQTLPRPSYLQFVRLHKGATNEVQHRLRQIQKQADILEKQRHVLHNRALEFHVSVREDKVIKALLERQSEILAFVTRKVVWMKGGVNLSREHRLMDKMKMWMTLQLEKKLPVVPKPASISVVSEPRSSAPAIVPLSPRSSGMAKVIAPSKWPQQHVHFPVRNLWWIDDFPTVDLVWFGKEKEKNFNSLLKWYEDALQNDVSLATAKVLSEQIVKSLVRHWIDVRNSNTSVDPQKLRRDFLDHARQLKANLQANPNLRADIVQEVITPEALMTMSKDDMASPELFQQRQELQQSAMRQTILQPMEGNVLIKTRDGFREVPVPVTVAGSTIDIPETLSQYGNLQPDVLSQPTNVDSKGPAVATPTGPSTTKEMARHEPTPQVPPKPFPPTSFVPGHPQNVDAMRMNHDKDRMHQANSHIKPLPKRASPLPIPVPVSRPAASTAPPIKRHRSIDATSIKKTGSPLKRTRSTDDQTMRASQPQGPRPAPTTWKVNAPVVPSPAALAMDMSSLPNLTPSIEVQQTRGFIREIFTNQKSVIANVTKLIQVGNILGQQSVAPEIIAKTETISIPGMGSVVRVHIGKFTVQSTPEKGASMGQVKQNGVKAFVEAIENLRKVFVQVVEKYWSNRQRGMDKVPAAQELVQSFPDVIVQDTQARPKEFICTWHINNVLVCRQAHAEEYEAKVCGWKSFSDFLESMISKVVKGSHPSAKKSRTDEGPTTASTISRGSLKPTSRAPTGVVSKSSRPSGECSPASPHSPVDCYEAEIMPSKYSRQH
ncbi:hypothetical protein H310_03990 [Aphanomyces invadans]|uniref:TFIIS central domain-containing protein n=1 Tax=Aphanomyces invadans TaxID=157072 RepID=A0A024UGY8_9STRA|nr:hypothetical protein H310_03990 [Aphanomyces invadans]ETW04878.1 hypothetical protein H310_03990 [Aphanomyces invadans]|eukprot:XP_008866316.1 hypothetical protein H310_03990 [Aphanomyces invadans]